MMYSSRGTFVTDPPFRGGANFHELVPSFRKDRDESATLFSRKVQFSSPTFFIRNALHGFQMVGTTCTLPEA
jgi:hypothetical protein